MRPVLACLAVSAFLGLALWLGSGDRCEADRPKGPRLGGQFMVGG